MSDHKKMSFHSKYIKRKFTHLSKNAGGGWYHFNIISVFERLTGGSFQNILSPHLSIIMFTQSIAPLFYKPDSFTK